MSLTDFCASRGLPIDCGSTGYGGVGDIGEWRDWSSRPTTPDQRRIEDYLDAFNLHDKTILHIGTGNSGLAARFSKRAKFIFGTTIIPEEVDRAEELRLPNYDVRIHNKYSGMNDLVPFGFDFIVDNNLTTFCCCMRHFEAMMRFYASRLQSSGQIITDRIGLGWTTGLPLNDARWAFAFSDLAEAASHVGLQAFRLNDYTYVLARNYPDQPSMLRKIMSRGRSLFERGIRRTRRLRDQLARSR